MNNGENTAYELGNRVEEVEGVMWRLCWTLKTVSWFTKMRYMFRVFRAGRTHFTQSLVFYLITLNIVYLTGSKGRNRRPARRLLSHPGGESR